MLMRSTIIDKYSSKSELAKYCSDLIDTCHLNISLGYTQWRALNICVQRRKKKKPIVPAFRNFIPRFVSEESVHACGIEQYEWRIFICRMLHDS